MSSSSPAVFLQIVHDGAVSHQAAAGVATGQTLGEPISRFLQKGVFDPRQFSDTTMSPNFGPDKVHSWSFGLEREFTKNSALEIRYVGNKGQNLFQSVNGNPDVAVCRPASPTLIPAGITACPADSGGRRPCRWPRELQPGYHPYPQ